MNWLPVTVPVFCGGAPWLTGIYFPTQGYGNHAKTGAMLSDQGNVDGKFAGALNKLPGAIQGINMVVWS